MIAAAWAWLPPVVLGTVATVGAWLALRTIREHGPADPYPWDPEGEGD